jgi:ATP-dependent Lhr-like helicase
MAEGIPGGFAGVYPVLAALEEPGRARRGYFVDGLGRRSSRSRRRRLACVDGRAAPTPRRVVLASTDPANPYGAALPWPERVMATNWPTGHRPGRKAGALVVLTGGELALYVERGGRTCCPSPTIRRR